MQQKMMKYMTIFMGLMFYKVASGLCLYFIASSLWGIAERKLLPKAVPADGSPTTSAPAVTRSATTSNGGTSKASGGAPRSGKAKRKK
jgi:YidC/Oxa1 family membrane protein insertase